jgi:ATP-binding cassette subfamily F protein 3
MRESSFVCRQLRAVRRARAEQLALQQATYVKQQRQLRICIVIDRFRAKATKAKQAQSRIKALERMELIAAAHVDSPFEFTFARSRDRAAACPARTATLG